MSGWSGESIESGLAATTVPPGDSQSAAIVAKWQLIDSPRYETENRWQSWPLSPSRRSSIKESKQRPERSPHGSANAGHVMPATFGDTAHVKSNLYSYSYKTRKPAYLHNRMTRKNIQLSVFMEQLSQIKSFRIRIQMSGLLDYLINCIIHYTGEIVFMRMIPEKVWIGVLAPDHTVKHKTTTQTIAWPCGRTCRRCQSWDWRRYHCVLFQQEPGIPTWTDAMYKKVWSAMR